MAQDQTMDIEDRIIMILKKERERITISGLAEKLKLHRNTLTKYVYRLDEERKIKIKKIGKAKVCYPNSKNKKGRANLGFVLLSIIIFYSITLLLFANPIHASSPNPTLSEGNYSIYVETGSGGKKFDEGHNLTCMIRHGPSGVYLDSGYTLNIIGLQYVDTIPPTPNPAQIESITVTNTSLNVTAVETTDDFSSIVYYRFNETTGNPGASSSDWQTSRYFLDEGLTPSTQYCYNVQYKDYNDNTGNESQDSCKCTLANIPTNLQLTTLNPTQIYAEWNANGNPAGTYYNLERNGTSIYSSTSTNYTDSSLNCSSQYSYRVRAKNCDNVYTDFTSNVTAWTKPENPILNSTTHSTGVWSSNNLINVTATTSTPNCADHYHYKWDTSSTTTVTGTDTEWDGSEKQLTATSDGNWYLHAIAHNPNNDENSDGTQHLGPFKIDTTLPTTTATAVKSDGSDYSFGEWTNSNYVNVTLSCSDSGSGCDITQYCTDTDNSCTPSTTYSTPVQISTEGTSYIRFRSNDTVGNLETTKNETIKIDTTSPVLNFTPPTEPNGTTISRNWTEANITIDEPDLDTFKFNWNTTNHTFYDDSLVLGMNLNNNSAIGENSTKAVDISKYGNNGTLENGTAWTTSGRFGSALSFDGTDDYVNCGDTAVEFASGVSFSFSFWFKGTGHSSSDDGIITKGYGGGDGGLTPWYLEYYETDGTIALYLRDSGDSSSHTSGTIAIDDGNWHFITAVYDAGAGEIRNYVDTELDTTTIGVPEDAYGTNAGNFILMDHYERYTQGTLDEVRIYNRSLSTEEIQMHYKSEFSKYNSTQYRFYDNVTDLADGTYTYYGWANDTASNEGQTDNNELRYLNVDLTSPTVTIYSPENTTYGVSSVDLNYTTSDSDSGVDSCWYSLDSGENQNLPNCQNATLTNLSDGQHQVTIYANDSVGNIGSSSANFTISTLDLYLTKSFNPDLLVSYEKEQVNTTTKLKINHSYTNVLDFNLTDEVPWDFSLNNDSITVKLLKYSPGSETDVTDNVTININDLPGENNTRIEINCSNTSSSFGNYLEENDTIILNYLMNSSELGANQNRTTITFGNITDTNSNSKNRTINTTISVAEVVLRGYKDLTVDLANPQNISASIITKAIGGTLGNISLVDYLPEGATIYNRSVYWFNGTYNELTEGDDFNITVENVTLPGGYRGEAYQYNFTYTGVTWPGQLQDNESLIINYTFIVLGGGQWDLPAIISGYDPTHKKDIKTEMYADANVPSFDVTMELLSKIIYPGEIVKALLRIVNVGGPRAKVDIFSNYAIKTLEEDIVTEKSETFAVVEQKEKLIDLDIPEDIEPGTYTFETFVTYTGREALSSETFKVEKEQAPGFLNQYGIYLIVGILIVLNLIILVRKR